MQRRRPRASSQRAGAAPSLNLAATVIAYPLIALHVSGSSPAAHIDTSANTGASWL